MRASLLYALLAAGMALGWQALTVHFNYRGDWSALFDTGGYVAMPPDIERESVYRFPDSAGYDGQFYHVTAHDPLLAKADAQYLDNPRLRWRRILLPALAFLCAGGDRRRVDSAYEIVVLAFVFAGAYWLALWCRRAAVHPAYSLAFVLVPAVLVSLDRFTIDVALAALAIAFAVYGAEERGWRILLVLAAAPFARETGLIAIAAFAVYGVLLRDRRALWLSIAAAVPYSAWLWYVNAHTNADQSMWASRVPFLGIARRTLHPVVDAVNTQWLRTAALLDYVALLGIWAAALLAGLLVWRRKRDLVAIAAALFAAVFVVFLADPQSWSGAYSFGRTMSPLLIWLGLAGVARRSWLLLLPLAMVIPRIFFQLGPQWSRVLHGLLR